jgi:hypothetical protein
MRDLIASRSWLIFEDMEVPFEWGQFLLKTMGEKPLSWSGFLASCPDRDAREESRRRELRHANQAQFDIRRGPERWLLDARGRAVLQEDVEELSPPRIFNDWDRSSSSQRNSSSSSLPEKEEVLGSQDAIYQDILQRFQHAITSGMFGYLALY